MEKKRLFFAKKNSAKISHLETKSGAGFGIELCAAQKELKDVMTTTPVDALRFKLRTCARLT